MEVFQSQMSATTDLSEFTLLANDERSEGSWVALLTCFLRLPLLSQSFFSINIGTQGVQELFFVNKKPLEVLNGAYQSIVKP